MYTSGVGSGIRKQRWLKEQRRAQQWAKEYARDIDKYIQTLPPTRGCDTVVCMPPIDRYPYQEFYPETETIFGYVAETLSRSPYNYSIKWDARAPLVFFIEWVTVNNGKATMSPESPVYTGAPISVAPTSVNSFKNINNSIGHDIMIDSSHNSGFGSSSIYEQLMNKD
jgi:hypothetical protein